MKYFKVSNYIVTAIKEKFQHIGYQIQLETLLIKKNVSDEAFIEMVIFYVVTLVQSLKI